MNQHDNPAARTREFKAFCRERERLKKHIERFLEKTRLRAAESYPSIEQLNMDLASIKLGQAYRDVFL